MKKNFTGGLILLSLFFISPVLVYAHASEEHSSVTVTNSSNDMMDNEISTDLQHQEMEELMVKMMTNTMTEEEARKMITLMQNMEGGMGSMMGMENNKMHEQKTNVLGFATGYGMHQGIGVLGVLVHLVFLILGILGIVWVYKKIIISNN